MFEIILPLLVCFVIIIFFLPFLTLFILGFVGIVKRLIGSFMPKSVKQTTNYPASIFITSQVSTNKQIIDNSKEDSIDENEGDSLVLFDDALFPPESNDD